MYANVVHLHLYSYVCVCVSVLECDRRGGGGGRAVGRCEQAVADTMADTARLLGDVQFVVNVGDSFYPDGVRNKSDPSWDSKWRNVYSKAGRCVRQASARPHRRSDERDVVASSGGVIHDQPSGRHKAGEGGEFFDVEDDG